VAPNTLARSIYGDETVFERHRHRYEFNNVPRSLHAGGLPFLGLSKDDLVEIIELPGHPWFVATQFHPEFTSTPRDGHPLFTGFVRAARRRIATRSCRKWRAPEPLQSAHALRAIRRWSLGVVWLFGAMLASHQLWAPLTGSPLPIEGYAAAPR
jgi:hypothetical protein